MWVLWSDICRCLREIRGVCLESVSALDEKKSVSHESTRAWLGTLLEQGLIAGLHLSSPRLEGYLPNSMEFRRVTNTFVNYASYMPEMRQLTNSNRFSRLVYQIALSVRLRIYWLYPFQPSNTLQNKSEILSMTLNYITRWGSRSGDLGSLMSPLHCHYSLVYSDPLC